ncbi:MAG: subclass B3 metallo-beta-lactamase [Pedobacter sp.]|nr:MAG: subclass B3 metallo-beta-lactamase [Pedobacter sp.]
MKPFQIFLSITLLIIITIASPTSAQKVEEPKNLSADWYKPYPPFRIAGNLYYVGTYDLACYLIVTEKGNILINTGLANSTDIISNNIKSLGFKLTDTKILMTTQAHYDHMAAMAAIKKLTGAKVWVNKRDAQVMRDGGSSDYALGNGTATYAPLNPDRLLKDGDVIQLGTTKLTMLAHPGHTKGSSSYIFDTKDNKRTYKVLIANIPTIVTDKRFSEVTAYPEIEKDYNYTINAMRSLKFDIWVASHASQFDLHKKHKTGDPYNPAAFADRKSYDYALSQIQADIAKHTLK